MCKSCWLTMSKNIHLPTPSHHEGTSDSTRMNLNENPNVGQAYFGGYYGGQQGDKVLDKTKWNASKGKVIQIHCRILGLCTSLVGEDCYSKSEKWNRTSWNLGRIEDSHERRNYARVLL
ncbi:hypothetical protein M9H77_22838 [Catharanthus roseus]|uniref:Uncharacterized protein n=1 Tax=Catharanthus roseus TaxID=4058 RepID=A0ACC0ATB7_CATRO|nr:hypothetical protein M9H77_22838 [Catharanthus roseus]